MNESLSCFCFEYSVEVELAPGLLLALLEEGGGHGLDEVVGVDLRLLLVHAGERVPVLVPLVLLLHLGEIQLHALLLSGRAEVQLHSCVIAILQTGLGSWLSIVESTIEIRNGFGIELAGVETVGEDDSSGSLLVEVTLIDLLGFVADCIDSHLILSTGPRRIEVIIPSQHFFLIFI